MCKIKVFEHGLAVGALGVSYNNFFSVFRNKFFVYFICSMLTFFVLQLSSSAAFAVYFKKLANMPLYKLCYFAFTLRLTVAKIYPDG